MTDTKDSEPLGALLARRVKELEAELLRGFRGWQPPDTKRFIRSVAREIARDEAVEEARCRRREAQGTTEGARP